MPRCPCCGTPIEADFVRLDPDAATIATAAGAAYLPPADFELASALTRAWPRDARRDWLVDLVAGDAADPNKRLRHVIAETRAKIAPIGLQIVCVTGHQGFDGLYRLVGPDRAAKKRVVAGVETRIAV